MPTAEEEPDGNHDLEDHNGDEESGISRQQESIGTGESRGSQRRPLLRSSAPKRHFRTQSVEHTLVGLTKAMMAFVGKLKDDHNQSNPASVPEGSPAAGFTENAILLADQALSSPTSTTGHLSTVPEGESEVNSSHSNSDDNEDEAKEGDKSHGRIPFFGKVVKNKEKRRKSAFEESTDKFKEDMEVWRNFFHLRRDRVAAYLKVVLLYLLVPLIGVAGILYYIFNNPPTGKEDETVPLDGEENQTAGASASFILIFCARQIITFSMALSMQGFLIDFLALDLRIVLRVLGPVLTLWLVQSRGWPHIMFWWSIFDFAILSGDSRFVKHWLFWQDSIGLFNESNPSGNIVSNDWYLDMLIVAVTVSVVVSIKRFLVGLYLSRQTFSHYGQPLANVMNKIVLVSEVAGLARSIASDDVEPSKSQLIQSTGLGISYDGEDDGNTCKSSASGGPDLIVDTNNIDPLTGSLHYTEKMKLMQLLDQWEEPTRHDPGSSENATISAVLRFRKALTFVQNRYPFGQAFGLADNRETCVESAQKVYLRLMTHSPTEVLQFERIALLAIDDNENIDPIKAKDLIQVFRPDRQGFLTMIDFVRSVDSVYKEFRLLDASIQNSSQIDRAFENIFNFVFYTIVVIIVLSQLGFDPLALFLSLSSIILAFAFMIGNASANYFEGLLFILVRKPYGIGDRISVAPVESDTSLDGVMPWVVQHVTLFETVVTFLPTNETASLSNGSLAASRIVNWARSPQAQFHIFLEFPLETPYEKLLIFKTAIEEYIKARPREWRALNGFRVNRIYAQKNYIEFIIVIQHREAWQEIGTVLDSKANLTSYCQEVSKQLGLQYQAPKLPVDLRYSAMPAEEESSGESNRSRVDSLDQEALQKEFQSVARNKHQIRAG